MIPRPLSPVPSESSFSHSFCVGCNSPIWENHKNQCEFYVPPETCTCDFHQKEIKTRSLFWGYHLRHQNDKVKVPNPYTEKYHDLLADPPSTETHVYQKATKDQHAKLNQVLPNQTVDETDPL